MAFEEPRVKGTLPLYGDPRAVHSITHDGVGVLTGGVDFGFAETQPVLPVTVDEFQRAALDYPIVFTGEDRQPYVVTAVEAGRNLFVAEGAYRPGAYIPAYLRRYPFALARDEGSEALILCLDHASDRVAPKEEGAVAPLFEGGELTALTRQALLFCEGYEQAQARTRALVDLLVDLDLFEARQAHYTPPEGGDPILLLDYLIVSSARIDALDADAFLRLRDTGMLAAVYAQMASQANWDVLAIRRED